MIRDALAGDENWILNLEKNYFKFPRTSIDINDFAVDNEQRGYIDMKIIIDEGYIGNVLVAEDYRRCGIADDLIDYIINKSLKNNLSFVTLEVRESNYPAISLYKKHGFIEEGRLKSHYSDPKEDALVMTVRRLN